MQKKSVKLLWLDDQINNLLFVVDSLRIAGIHVDIANTVTEGIKLSEDNKNKYNIIIADIRMPKEDIDGIEWLRRIQPNQKRAIFAVLSSYLYLKRYRDELRQLIFPVQLMDKDLPLIGSSGGRDTGKSEDSEIEEFDFTNYFVNSILKLIQNGVTFTINDQDGKLEKEPEEDPFEIPLADFMQKSMLEKEKLMDKAKKIALSTINRAFDEGKIWVFLCGSKDQIRGSASDGSEIMPEDEMMSFAIKQQRAPFHFYKPIEIEELWNICGDKDTLKDYPTITLGFKEGDITTHFDTGNPRNLFSYEELLTLEPTFPNRLFTDLNVNNVTCKVTDLNMRVILICQITGQTKFIILRGNAVRNWESLGAPFMRECTEKCERNKINQGDRWFCPERKALIGRNIMIDNDLVLILDGKNKKTGYLEE